MDEETNAGFAPEPNAGDFGEGTGSLEEQLLNSLPEESGDEETSAEEGSETEKVETKAVVAASTDATSASKAPLFDATGKLSVRDGETIKVTPELRKELEGGQLRLADYTRKTQEVAKIRNEAQDILKGFEEIQADARNLFKHISPQKVLSAFTRQEMLSHGLHAGGVSPKLWNQFLEWRKESGEEVSGDDPRADPYSQQLAEFSRKIEAIERREEQIKAERQERAHAEQMANYDKEVEGALKDFPAVNRRQLLVEMAASDGTKTIKELAKDLSEGLEARFQDYLKTKIKQKETTVKAPKGTAVPVQRKRPKTFEEADALVANFYGNGTLHGTESFGS